MDEKLGYPSPEPSSTPREASPKRSAEAAGLDESDGKFNRKRASKACQSCRSRKVRCGVSDHGVPCHNCKLDDLECIVPERKRPTRTAKRQRSIRAVISEAVLRLGRSSPDSADSPPESVQGVINYGWDNPFQNPYETDLFESSSPAFLQQTTTTNDEGLASDGDARAGLELPPCGDELARWFNVMPPRVVDKMFSYLTTLSQRGYLEPTNSSYTRRDDLSQCHSKPRLSSSDQNHDTSSRKPVIRHCITPQAPEYARQLLGPATRELSSPVRESPHPLAQEPPKTTSILQQLRNDYAAAAGRARALEETIQKVDSQFTKQQSRHIGDRYLLDTYSEPPDPTTNNGDNNNKPSPLTPPPENQTAFVMSMQTVQQLEALLASVHKESESRPQKQENAQDVTQGIQDVTATESVRREDGFQNTFDSLMDFGAEADTMFQSFNYDFSGVAEGV